MDLYFFRSLNNFSIELLVISSICEGLLNVNPFLVNKSSILPFLSSQVCLLYLWLFNVYELVFREGNGIPLQYSCLENPMDRGAWWAAVPGVAKSRMRLSDFTFTFHFHAMEKEMATPSSVLAWRIQGTGEPGGLLSMGSHGVGHDWSDLAAAAWVSVGCSVVSDRQQPHGLQPTQLLHPWDFPGKSTGVGCHCLLWTLTHKH